MRIAWFTPCATWSAIGEFSRHVTAELSKFAERRFLDFLRRAEPGRSTELRTVFFSAEGPLDALATYDLAIYNIGNYAPFHRDIHHVSQRHPGIVILHDRVLHHLFADIWDGEEAPHFGAAYRSRMSGLLRASGGAARPPSVGSWRIPRPRRVAMITAVADFPLERAALQGAIGSVTHSQDHADDVRERWLGPVCAIPLPCYRATLASAVGMPRTGRRDGRIQLTTIGHVIPNKHVDRVISMLAADRELAGASHYTVAGSLDAGSEHTNALERLLRDSPHVSAELRGWCGEAELDSLSAATDVFVNLRDPVMESGSASLARELAHGRPVLCFDGGCFGEVAGDAVARVPCGDFAAAAAELRRLVADAGHRQRIGARALEVATQRSEGAYAAALLEFVGEVSRSAPALALLDRVAAQLGAMRADPSLPLHLRCRSRRDFGRALGL